MVRPAKRLCTTGIEDLDLLLQGGLKRGSLTVITGGMGSGRSSLCYEFLRRGSAMDEAGALMTSIAKKVYEQRLPAVEYNQGDAFNGITVTDFVSEDHVEPDSFSSFIDVVVKAIRSGAYKRLAVDSMEQMVDWLPEASVATGMRRIQEAAFDEDVTVVIACGMASAAELQAADCVLSLGMKPVGPDAMRTLEVLRCRGGMQPLSVYVMSFGKEGAMLTRLMEGSDD